MIDPQVLLFLILIVLVSGGIGVLADILGRKIGKRRIVFGRLRPKHTARLGTFLAGILTSTLTIVVVFAISAPVRKWIVEGTQIVNRYERLQQLNEQLKNSIAVRQKQSDLLDKKLTATSANLKSVQVQLKSVQVEAKKANQLLALAKSRELAALTRYHVAARKVSTTQALLHKMRLQYSAASANLKRVSFNLKTISAQNTDVSTKNLELTHQNDQLAAEAHKLTEDVSNLQSQIGELQTKINAADSKLTAEQTELRTTTQKLVEAKQEADHLTQQIATLTDLEEKYQAVTNLTLVNTITYGHNDEVARVEVPAHLSEADAIAQVDNLITAASAEARARGATYFKDSRLAADLAYPSGGNATNQRLLLAKQITDSREPLVIIALSAVNAVQQTPVVLVTQVHPNPLIYSKGKVLARKSFNAGLSINAIFDQLQTFIQTDVYRRAISNGIIPIAGRNDSVLNVGPADLFPVIDAISKNPLKSDVKVIVDQDTRAGDRLQIRFSIQ